MRILLIAYDNDSYIPFPPLGLMHLQAALMNAGHSCEIWHQDIHHLPEKHITQRIDMAALPGEKGGFDIVGLGFIAGYYQYAKAKKIAAAINACSRRNEFKFILGGHGPAAAMSFFLEKLGADCVFQGEAINSILGYINDGMTAQFKYAGELCDPDHFPIPLYSELPMEIYRLIRFPAAERSDFCFPILSGAGCKWKCTFCYRMDPGFRARSPEATIAEMIYLYRNWSINYFQFADELFMSSKERTVGFCEELIRAREKGILPDNFKFDCNARLNFAKPDVLAVMKRAGAQYLNYGIESLDPQVLKNINKGLTPDQIHEGVQNTLAAGLIPGLNLLWNNVGDNIQSLNLAADFIIKYNTGHELRTIRPVTPYPGSPLFEEALKRGLVDNVEDFYEKKHINSDLICCNFMDGITTDEAHNQLYKANLRILRHHTEAKRMKINQEAFDCYIGLNNNFRGFRDV